MTTTTTTTTRRSFARPPRARHRAGSAILQTIVVMQVLLIVFFGAVEFGQFLYVKHAFLSAARDAARSASLPSGTNATVTAALTATLAQANVTYNPAWCAVYDISADGSTTTLVTDVTTIASGDRVQVKLATTYDQVPNAFRPLFAMFGKGIGPGKPMGGTCTMVKE